MFKTLHKKLTAFHLIILAIFFMIFSSFIYLRMDHMLRTSSKIAINGLSKQIKTLHELPELHGPPLSGEKKRHTGERNIIIILRDASLNVSATTSYDTELLESTSKEIGKMFDEKEDARYSQISFDDTPYRLYTAYFLSKNGEWGIAQIGQNIEFEKKFLENLLKTLLLLGFFSIAILAAISWFLAKKSLEPIKYSWEQQKRFIADASHELRTPLTVMKANLEIPLQEKTGAISDHYIWLQNAYDETNNMSRIVNTLLELSQIDSGQNFIEKNRINLSELLNKSIESIKPLTKEKRINIIKEIENHIFIIGDEQKLKQLIVIFLDNALKYTESGTIKVILAQESSQIVMKISDTGIGISENDKLHIFDRFYRVDKTRSRAQGSLGLGLSIAKWIIEEHNGKVEIDSQLNKGSTFKITFPMP